MPGKQATSSGLADRYVTALFELAQAENGLDIVEADFARLSTALETSSDLDRLITSPLASRPEQGRAIEALAVQLGLSDLTKKFLGVLAAHRRLGALPAMLNSFRVMLATHRGEETAEVVSAVPLNDEQLGGIKDGISAHVGKPVSLAARVDPDLLGGLVVRIGSRMIDASLKTKLQQLELSMRGIG